MLIAIEEQIRKKNNLHTFAVLDGAAVNGLLDKIYQWHPKHVCLFRGKLRPDMAEVAPYLIRLEDKHPFSEWLIKHAWSRHWGVFFDSPLDEKKLRRKFRDLLNAALPDGRTVTFRFYDPRILNTYLPSCNKVELDVMFDGVNSYYVEDEEQDLLLRHEIKQGVLLTQGCA